MKICYFCEFENFKHEDFCERCNQTITRIRHERFNIADFIRRNYQLYAIFGILVALYEFLVSSYVPVEQKYVGIFPLIVAFYLIVHLIIKAAKIIGTRPWETEEELLRRESSFQFLIFSGIHILLIVALLVSLPENTMAIMGTLLGMFIFLIYFSANYTFEQYRKTFKILLSVIFCGEVSLVLIIIIPYISKFIDNAIFAFYYILITQIFLWLAFGGFLTWTLITVGYNMICDESIPFFYILQNDHEQEKYWLEIILGFEIFFGIMLGMVIFSLKDFYAGF